MSLLSKILTKLLYKLGLGRPSVDDEVYVEPYVEDQTQPKFTKLSQEPVMGTKDGNLVLVFRHSFTNIPSWVEWDQEREIVTVTHVNGDIDEAPLGLKETYLEQLKSAHRVLLISQEDGKQVAHFVQFLFR